MDLLSWSERNDAYPLRVVGEGRKKLAEVPQTKTNGGSLEENWLQKEHGLGGGGGGGDGS